MYAVVTTGGKQYRVEAGSMLVVEKLVGEPGSSVTFDRVLLVGDGDSVTVGTPTVPGATVSATVLGNERGRKIVVFKFKQKVKYRRRTGHRQELTRLRVDAITADGKTVRAQEPARKAAPAAAPKAEKAQADTKVPRRTRAKAIGDVEAAAEATEPAKPARRPRARAAATAEGEAGASASGEKPKAPAKPRTPRTRKPASAKEE